MLNFLKIKKYFVSEIDQFLMSLDRKLPESDSQQEEITQYKRIAKLRDQKNANAREER
jgi:hypothetical protein